MKIIGVIPARYASSRFPGKPLADIEGKPMIWWVYNQCKKVSDFDEVYVATDSENIQAFWEIYISFWWIQLLVIIALLINNKNELKNVVNVFYLLKRKEEL